MIREIAGGIEEFGDDPSTLAAEIVRLRLEVAEARYEASRVAAAHPIVIGPGAAPTRPPTVRWSFGDPPLPEGPPPDRPGGPDRRVGDGVRRRIGYVR